MTISLGYQIPNFTYPGGVETLFDTVVAQAREAEQAGFDTVAVMDHFYQLPGIGSPDNPMLEAYTTLGALAASTSSIQLSTLVTGITYRNPALLAKAITTLDVISHGRAVLAMGTGWYELEHNSLGFEFGTFGDRFRRLDEALEIILPMVRGERPSFEGTWYRAQDAMAEPRYRERIPVMLGGSGEQKTFRIAARHADHMNIIAPRSELAHKVAVLAERCEEINRDPATLETSYLTTVIPVENAAERTRLAETLPPRLRDGGMFGSPDEIAGRIADEVIGVGVTGLFINMTINGHEPGRITAMADALRPVVHG